MITEDKLETLCLDWFESIGYRVLNGHEIAPDSVTSERESYEQVVLKKRLHKRISLLNPELCTDTILKVVSTVTTHETLSLIERNRTFHKYLVQGVPIEYTQHRDGEVKTTNTYAKLIDFDQPSNNEFLVVNQFTVKGNRQNRRPDIVVFINGLPISVIELKNPADENTDITHAFHQIQTYKNDIPNLFAFNESLVISDGLEAQIGSLTADFERFMPWRTVDNEDDRPLYEYQLQTVVEGFYKPDLLLDYLRYFVLFETNENRIIKKIAGYHQFHAARAAVQATIKASGNGELQGDLPALENIEKGGRKAGVVWHTQGSGKGISMVCYVAKLLQQSEMNNPTIVIVTDRNDLDGQLYNTFSMARDALKQSPNRANSKESLRNILQATKAGGIVFTTIQKFNLDDNETHHPILSSRSNVVVISDEAHRSHYGNRAELKGTKGYVYGYSKYMRDALPNASFIGFTGTPISNVDKNTRGVFGDYVSIYDIQDAINDGATVPIYYESRLAKLTINRTEVNELNEQVDVEITEDVEVSQREKIKSEWANLEKLVGAKARIDQVAQDLVSHYTTRSTLLSGKAMIVCMSREICVALYDAIVAIRPDWHNEDPDKGTIKIVMTGSASDKAKLQPHIYDNQTKKRLASRFKDPDNELELVIVRDMWLTGFDAPCCHTMYIDKPMRGHNLMQAIARVNRVFKDKPGGLVVDYIGIANELKLSVKTYSNARHKNDAAINAADALSVVIEKIDVIRGMLATPVNGKTFESKPDYENNDILLLRPAIDHLSGLSYMDTKGKEVRNGKRRFLDAMAALNKAYALCNTLDDVDQYREEIGFYSAVRAAFLKLSNSAGRLAEDRRNTALKQIIDNAVIAEGVDDLFSLVGLDKPNIGLLSDEFLEDVRNMKEQNFAVELLAKLLKDEIKARMKNDVVQEKKYSDRILDTLNKYHNRSIETAQVIEELIKWAKEMQEDEKLMDKLKLSSEEIAFYRALADNESAVRTLSNNELRNLAIELTASIRGSVTIDWHKRESVRAGMRNRLRRLLRKWKYPPDKAADAIELVLKQAEAFSTTL